MTGPAASAERLGAGGRGGGKYAAKWRLIKSHNVLSCGSSRVGGYFRGGGGKRGYIFHLSISMSVQYYCNGILCSFRGVGGGNIELAGIPEWSNKESSGVRIASQSFPGSEMPTP